MPKIILGKTGIITDKNGFGALPIQRIDKEAAKALLLHAYENGINFFDTARFYTDSEAKIGDALSHVRDKIILASKTMTTNADEFWRQLETSLTQLRTDYLDIYQFHNPPFCPKPGDGSGLYEAMIKAKEQGMIRHIGITNHRLLVAMEAVDSGLYETIQFPFNYLSTEGETTLVKRCKEENIGFIAMKALSGGLITNTAAAYAFLNQFDHVLPIWGVQKESELREFLEHGKNPPTMENHELHQLIEHDRRTLSGEFCRGCGYCMPCPAGIDIPTAARMSLLVRRAPLDVYLNEEFQEKMRQTEKCTHCGHCRQYCPYGLDTPKLIEENWADYRNFI